jgi:hypothetical protein
MSEREADDKAILAQKADFDRAKEIEDLKRQLAAQQARAEMAEAKAKDHADALEGAQQAAVDARAEADARAADAKQKLEAAHHLRVEAELQSPKQSAAPGGWDKPDEPAPGMGNDRVRGPVFDQLMHHLPKHGHDMPRGVKSTARDILRRISRLHDHKLTPFEATLKPLLEAWAVRGWKPDPSAETPLQVHMKAQRANDDRLEMKRLEAAERAKQRK